MNAFGVPVFYCALSSETAIKEVRPSIGSYVVVGKFSAVRLLKLLDLTRAGKIDPGGIFSPGYKARKEKLGFLASFDSIVSQPIRPHREALEYLPTQMFAEYIQHELGYDGVVYSSAQESDGGELMKKNIALFGCADWRVKNIGESETDKESESDWLFENDPWLKIASDNGRCIRFAKSILRLQKLLWLSSTRSIALEPIQMIYDMKEWRRSVLIECDTAFVEMRNPTPLRYHSWPMSVI